MSEHATFLRDINDGLSQKPKYISGAGRRNHSVF